MYVYAGTISDDSEGEVILPVFDDEYDLYDPTEEPTEEPEPLPSLQSAPEPLLSLQSAPEPLPSLQSAPEPLLSLQSAPTSSGSRESTTSTACRRRDLAPGIISKRPRKPSPPRQRQRSANEKLDEFISRGCRCAKKCHLQFSKKDYEGKRDEANYLTREELDMMLMGKIMALTQCSDVVGPSHRHAPTQRKKTRATFFHQGKKICRDTFLALHGIGKQIIINFVAVVL